MAIAQLDSQDAKSSDIALEEPNNNTNIIMTTKIQTLSLISFSLKLHTVRIFYIIDNSKVAP